MTVYVTIYPVMAPLAGWGRAHETLMLVDVRAITTTFLGAVGASERKKRELSSLVLLDYTSGTSAIL